MAFNLRSNLIKPIFKTMLWIFAVIAVIYSLILFLLFRYQEKFIFLPDKLEQNFVFKFDNQFEEKFIETSDNKNLHGLLFKAKESKGLVFYLHGNEGAVNSWDFLNDIYTNRGYDLFLLDYRGYGKSSGTISGEKQFLDDIEQAYSAISKTYADSQIVIIGHSLGTYPAAVLAAKHSPGLLMLLSPYYSLQDIVSSKYPVIPNFILKYKFPTFEFIPKISCPIVIFHGQNDKLIKPESAIRLKKLAKTGDELYIIQNLGHNGINQNLEYQDKLKELLGR